MKTATKEWKPEILTMLKNVREASFEASQLSAATKKKVLLEVAEELRKDTKHILSENKKDLVRAEENGLTSAMIDRLTLNKKRIEGMAEGVEVVAKMKDIIGEPLESWKRPNGLSITKVAVPIGAILIIYESRPNVTVECASLCFKSGNSVILRGGKEAFHSNRVLASVFEKVLKKHNLAGAMVSLIQTTDRAVVDFLLKKDREIQLVIPRGGESLIRKVVRASRIPVIKHYQGVCHVYVDKKADLQKAVAIAYNAKMHRPGVCNAMETLLVHKDIASEFLPAVGEKLREGGCEVRAGKDAREYLPWATPAKKSDFGHEYLEKILALKIVDHFEDAINHIKEFGSGHTDAIVTEDPKAADLFKKQVDSASVMVNASTRFSDGFEFGFGAEIGISTDKIHARGPMGLQGLTSYKYLVEGKGQIRS